MNDVVLIHWLMFCSLGKISSWIDLDSEDEVLRMDSETTLKQEIAWATHLSLQVLGCDLFFFLLLIVDARGGTASC